MSLEREVLADQSEARQESLCAIRIKEATHAPKEVPLGDSAFAFKRRLMASFGTVVHPSTGFDENLFDIYQFGDLGFRSRVTAQLIGDFRRGASGQAASTRFKKRFAAALSRGFCSRRSSSATCWSTASHSRQGSPRNVTNTSSRCHVLPGVRRAAFMR
jgi:hypothetical protein